MLQGPSLNPEFSVYADKYDVALNQGLSVSGESKEYFARGRADWLNGILKRMQFMVHKVLDFGCGTGAATPFLLAGEESMDLLGVDISEPLLEVARRDFGSERARFARLDDIHSSGDFDLAYCNGVFHHIPPVQRLDSLAYIRGMLRPGGLFAFWENNPWNPGARYVMSRIPFDKDAITLTPPEARRLLERAGFEVLKTHFLFVFPGPLRFLRFLEPFLARWPIGAQYQILCRKPNH